MATLSRKLPTFALALALTLAPMASADVVIGNEGQTFSVVGGTYGELSPGGFATAGENPVLMIEARLPGENAKLHLVPGTEDPQWEEAPALVYEDASNTLYLVWISWASILHPVVNLIGFGPDGWSERIELVGNPFAAKSRPAVAVTRDSFLRVDAVGGPVEAVRTLVHLVWGQEGTGADWDAIYAPVLFVDGVYTGQTPILRLEDVIPSLQGPGGLPAASPRWTTPVLRTGRDASTVVMGFDSPAGDRLRTAEIKLVPADLVRLAGDARAHIIDTGARAETPAELRSLGDAARAHIIDTGIAFDVNIVRSLADAARAHIIDTGVTIRSDDDLRRVAAGARAHIIDTGVTLSHGLRRAVAAASTTALVALPVDGGAEHLLAFGALSSRPAPPPAEDLSVFLSRRGTEAIVAWSDGLHVFYLESEGESWSDRRAIELGPRLSIDEALEGLESRISDR